jgi:hypothetical protein
MDQAAANREVRERLRTDVPELRHDDTAAVLTEKFLSSFRSTPAVFVLIRFYEARESVPGSKRQRVDLEVIVGLVTQSVGDASGAMKGATGSDAIAPKIRRSLHWWKPDWALERLKFRGESDPIVSGSLLLNQYKFATAVMDTYL